MVRGWKECVILLALFFAPLVVFSPSLRYDFVTFDDGMHVYRNPRLSPPTWKHVASFWKEPFQGLYVPLTYTVWSAEAALVQRPWIFHLGNLLLHGVNTVLLFLLLRQVSFPIAASVAGSLLFAWHPLQVEPVAWISALKDVLSGFWMLLSLLLYSRAFRGEKRTGVYVGAIACFVLALLAKPSAVILPLVAGLWDRLFLGRSWKENWKYWAPGLFALVPITWITKNLQPNASLEFIPNAGQRILVALDSCAFYLGKLFFPFMLSVNYGRTPQAVLTDPRIYLLAAIPLVVLFLVWRRRQWKTLWLGFGIFLLAPLPVLGFIPFYYQKFSTVADRYLYFGILGPALAFAWWLSSRRTAGYVLASILLAALAVRSQSQLEMWEDNSSLIRQIGRVNASDPDVHYSLAIVLSEESQLPGETSFYSQMLRLPQKERSEAARLDRQEQAIYHYQEAIRLNPNHAFAHHNLGTVYHRMSRLSEAERHFREATRIEPEMAQAYNNLGATLAQQGKLPEALKAFESAARLQPKDEGISRNLKQTQLMIRKRGKG